MRGNFQPFSWAKPKRVVVKPVFIGNHAPNEHFAPGLRIENTPYFGKFLQPADLYDNRTKKERR